VAGAGQDQDRTTVVSVEAPDRVGQLDGGGVVDGVVGLRAVDRDDGDRAVAALLDAIA
jgi:hypothetical protein